MFNGKSDELEEMSSQDCGLISQQYLNAGEYEKAAEYAQAQLRKSQIEFDDEQTIAALFKLGRINRDIGQQSEAFKFYRRAASLSEQLGIQRSLAVAYDQLGSLHRVNNEFEKALEFYKKSLSIHEELSGEGDIGVECGNIGSLLFEMGKLQEAETWMEKAIKYSMKVEDHRNLSIWYLNLGSLQESRGEITKAIAAYQDSFRRNSLVGNRHLAEILMAKMKELGVG